ncbi:MAG: oligoendopeptidase F, partial [Pseudomonadota bacterium]
MQRPVFDTATETGGADLGPLPEWDLSDLYPAMDSPELAADFDKAASQIEAFAAAYQGKLGSLDGDALAAAIAENEEIELLLGRIMSYAGLLYQQNTQDTARAKFMGDCQGRYTQITQPMVFFTLELNRLDDAHLDGLMDESAALTRYRPWLGRLRSFRPHQLSDELETFLHDQSVVGASAWNRLFDETMSGLTFDVEGHDAPMGLSETLNLLSNQERSEREAGGKALAATLDQNIRLFTLITNTLAKEKEIEDRWRKLPAPDHGRHLANHVEPEVVDALREAVVAA